MAPSENTQQQTDDMWHEVLTHGHHTRMAVLPGSPRCNLCRIPVGGIGGALLKPFGRGVSRKNPNLCNL